MSFDLGLSGRRALVTAGTKGVGSAVVEVLRENGANVDDVPRSLFGEHERPVEEDREDEQRCV